MPLGICMRCDKLCPIAPSAKHALSRECVWRPLLHDKIPRHKSCGDELEAVEFVDRDGAQATGWRCPACATPEAMLVPEVEVDAGRCDGHKFDIVSREPRKGLDPH